jgi:ABC-type dipeptide/oligopeptide/nickel transport system permease component
VNVMTSLVVIFANLAVDITYSWLNPRIRYS